MWGVVLVCLCCLSIKSIVNLELGSGLFFCRGRREHRPLFWPSVALKIKLACSAASIAAKKPGLHPYLCLRTERDVVFKRDNVTTGRRSAALLRSPRTFSIVIKPALPSDSRSAA
jgi:hypothetical protein